MTATMNLEAALKAWRELSEAERLEAEEALHLGRRLVTGSVSSWPVDVLLSLARAAAEPEAPKEDAHMSAGTGHVASDFTDEDFREACHRACQAQPIYAGEAYEAFKPYIDALRARVIHLEGLVEFYSNSPRHDT